MLPPDDANNAPFIFGQRQKRSGENPVFRLLGFQPLANALYFRPLERRASSSPMVEWTLQLGPQYPLLNQHRIAVSQR